MNGAMRVSPFIVVGAVLVLGFVISVVAWIADGLTPAVDFGYSGVAAIGIAWAAYARTLPRAAGRTALVAALAMLAFIAAVLVALFGTLPIDLVFPRGTEAYELLDDGSAPTAGEIAASLAYLTAVVTVFAAIGAAFGSLASLYAHLPRSRFVRLAAGAGAVAPLMVATLFSLENGDVARALAGALATVWLWVALRRARDGHAAAAPEPGPLVATS